MNKAHNNKNKELKKTFLVDATGEIIYVIISSSPSTVVVESGVGIAQGGRTGLTAVFAVVIFLLFLFLAPLICTIHIEVISPALVLIGIMMMQKVANVQWNDFIQATLLFLQLL